MIKTDGHSAPSKADAVTASAIATLKPRLRKLLLDRGYSRSSVCRYLGMHTNSLNRLNDETWHPSLVTAEKIDHFLRVAEQDEEFDLRGTGWSLGFGGTRWWIDFRNASPSLGPFETPDDALAAGQAHSNRRSTFAKQPPE